ncbi:MAG: 5-formyltetrahydrofolate cyclo-ligase [Oligoflexales bacterium]|nr:5-formyltetrahydrofolate cyclo-ligase [Oligoflexales bacterium]
MSELIKKQKADLRSRLLSQRQAISSQDNAIISNKICEHLANYISASHFIRILTYVPFRNELDVCKNLIHRITNPLVSYYLPRIDPALRQMNFHRFSPQQDILEKNSYGIEEPRASQELFDESKNSLSLILVPALALDLSGVRLGYGAGYYDRYLSKIADITYIKSLGVVSDAFVMPTLPSSIYDMSLQAYVSEIGITNFSGQGL